MVFDGLTGGENLTIEVPVRDDRAECTLSYMPGYKVNRGGTSGPRLACTFRGNTAVEVQQVSPGTGIAEYDGYRVFRREHMRAEKAPEIPMPEYVHPDSVVKW